MHFFRFYLKFQLQFYNDKQSIFFNITIIILSFYLFKNPKVNYNLKNVRLVYYIFFIKKIH